MFRFSFPSRQAVEKEAAQTKKMEESQAALLTAAISTATAAQDVTMVLKRRLDDVVKQFESTARILRDGLILCREDGTILTFNPAAERIFDIKAGVIIQKNVLSLFEGADDSIDDVSLLWSLLQSEEHDDVLGVRDGTTFPVHVTLSVLTRHDDSRVVLLLVHDHPQSTDTRYQTIFEESLDGIVVLLDSTGNMQAVNPAVGRMFGYSPYSLMSMSLLDLITPTDRPRLASFFVEGCIIPQNFTIEGIHSSGRTLNLAMSLTDIEWEGNEAVLATIKDITELKSLDGIMSLKRDNGVDMVCIFDSSFRITFVNKTFAENFKSKRRLLIGMDIRTLMSDADAANFVVAIGGLNTENTSRRSMSRDDDRIYDWVDHGAFDKDGRVVEYQRTGRDVTDLANA